METFKNLAAAWVTLIYLVVLAVNVWQAVNNVNMPWSLAVAVLMLIAALLLGGAVTVSL